MRRTILVIALAILGSATHGAAQKAVESVHDFGAIGMDDPMEHTFEFQNDSTKVLEILNVQMNPPLIVTKMTARVEPGARGNVTVRLNKPREQGEFKGAIVVNFKDESLKPLELWATGDLVPPIEFDPMPAFFLSTSRGEAKTSSIEIKNHQAEPFEIINVVHNSSRFTTELETLEEGRHYRVTLTLKGDGSAGRQTDKVTLITSDREKPFLELQANTNINERVYTFPSTMDFESINVMALKSRPQIAGSFSAELTVYQKGGTNFRVLSAQTDVPFLRLSPFQADLKDRFGIRVDVIPEKLRAGTIQGTIVITTNDPEFPKLEVPVTGMVEGSW